MSIGNLTSIGNKAEAGSSKLYLISATVEGAYDEDVVCNFYSTQEIKTYEDLVNFLQQKNFTNRAMPCFGRCKVSGHVSEGIRFSSDRIEVYFYDAFDTDQDVLSQKDKSKIYIECDEV